MKALVSTAPGGPDTLQLLDLPIAEPGKGELRVRVEACGINYPDVLIIEDLYQMKPPRPFAPGSEIAGTIEAVGEGVEGWAPGDRMMAVIGHGGLAEQAIVPAARAVRLPQGRDAAEGAALLMTYATSYHALVDRGQLKPGETLLVLGPRAASASPRSRSARHSARPWSQRCRTRRRRPPHARRGRIAR